MITTKIRPWVGGVAVALLVGCATDPTDSAPPGAVDVAAVSDSIVTANDMASAPDLAGMMLGVARPPRIPSGLEGFRCDAVPTITETQVCGHSYPSSIALTWTACDAHPPRAVFGPRDGDMSSAGTVTITNSITMDPPNSCQAAAAVTFARSSTFDITTTAGDGSRQVAGSVMTSSAREATPRSFTNTETYDVTTTDKDVAGAVLKTRHLAGNLTTVFADNAGVFDRTVNGTATITIDGTTQAATITNLVRAAFLGCRWPTSGTIALTSGATTHTLVFGPTCGSATLDGAAITLPTHDLGHHWLHR